MGALALDTKHYGRLLARAVPRVIETEADNQRTLAEIEKLMDRGERRSTEEDTLLKLLVSLVQNFEEIYITHRARCPTQDASVFDGKARPEPSRLSSDLQIERLRIRCHQRETCD